MKALICPRCGESLSKHNDEFHCRYCGAIYTKEESQESEELLRSILQEAKLEALANRRRILWDVAHQPNISSTFLARAAADVREVYAEDTLARFYLSALSEDPAELNAFLLSEPFDIASAREVARFCLLSLDSRNVLAFRDFVERTFIGKEADKLLEEVSVEAKKLDEGVYLTSLPRDVFLAYSSADMEQVIRVTDFLEANNLRVFVAARNLRHGKGAQENYQKALYDAMGHCSTIVYLSSENSRSLNCDALSVELPFARDHLPKVGRIEYLIEPYGRRTVLSGKQMLKSIFAGKEWCTNEEDLLERILAYLAAKDKVCHHCHEVNPSSATHCHKCGYPLDKKEYEARIAKEKKEAEERDAWEKEKQRILERQRLLDEENRKKEEEASRLKEEHKRALEEEKARLAREAEEKRQAAHEKELELEKRRLELEKERLELEKMRSSASTGAVDGEALLRAMEEAQKKRDEEKRLAEAKRKKEEEERRKKEQEEAQRRAEVARRKAEEERRKAEEERRKAEEEKRKAAEKELQEFTLPFHKAIESAPINVFYREATFGLYPQTLVRDNRLAATLETLPRHKDEHFARDEIVVHEGQYYLRRLVRLTDPVYFHFEPIEWIVINRDKEGNATIVSKKVLDLQPFHEGGPRDHDPLGFARKYLSEPKEAPAKNGVATVFENSSLFRWLNETFLLAAFGGGFTEKLRPMREGKASIGLIEEEDLASIKERQCVPSDFASFKPNAQTQEPIGYWLDGYLQEKEVFAIYSTGRKSLAERSMPFGVRPRLCFHIPAAALKQEKEDIQKKKAARKVELEKKRAEEEEKAREEAKRQDALEEAALEKIKEGLKYKERPSLTEDGKMVLYGLYPQSHAPEILLPALMAQMNGKKEGKFTYRDVEFFAKGGKPYVIEPIRWFIISHDEKDGTYRLLSEFPLFKMERTTDNRTFRVVEDYLKKAFVPTAFGTSHPFLVKGPCDYYDELASLPKTSAVMSSDETLKIRGKNDFCSFENYWVAGRIDESKYSPRANVATRKGELCYSKECDSKQGVRVMIRVCIDPKAQQAMQKKTKEKEAAKKKEAKRKAEEARTKEEKAKQDQARIVASGLSPLAVNDNKIVFGRYPQTALRFDKLFERMKVDGLARKALKSGDGSFSYNGKRYLAKSTGSIYDLDEPVSWRVLSRSKDGFALVVAENLLDQATWYEHLGGLEKTIEAFLADMSDKLFLNEEKTRILSHGGAYLRLLTKDEFKQFLNKDSHVDPTDYCGRSYEGWLLFTPSMGKAPVSLDEKGKRLHVNTRLMPHYWIRPCMEIYIG